MSLTTEDVRRIAHLARLSVSEEEIPAYADRLSRILELIAEMQAVDTSAVGPMAHPHEAPLRLRGDAVSEPNEREKYQAIAPAAEAGLYLVPKVIEGVIE